MPGDRLFDYISEMSSSEKRYFKLYLSGASKNKENIQGQLFDYLCEKDQYEKNEVVDNCSFVKEGQLENVKSRLMANLLKSARLYHEEKTEELKLMELLSNYEILIRKGLFQHAYSVLNKAEKLAVQTHSIHLLFEIFDKQEYIAVRRLKEKRFKKMVPTIIEKKDKYARFVALETQLKNLASSVYSVFSAEGRMLRDVTLIDKQVKEYEKIEKEMADCGDIHGFSYLQHQVATHIQQLLGDFEKSEAYLNRSKQYFKQKKKWSDNDHYDYHDFLNMSIIFTNTAHRFEASKAIVKEMRRTYEKQVVKGNKHFDILNFENANFQEIELYIQACDFTKALELTQKFVHKIDGYAQNMHSVNQFSKYYRIALTYYGCGDFKNALKWINRILNFDTLKYRKDILSSTQLLQIMTHFKLKNYDLIPYLLTSAKQKLKKIDRWLPPEILLLQAIESVAVKMKNRKKVMEHLALELEQNALKNPLDRYAMAYFDLISWAKKEM